MPSRIALHLRRLSQTDFATYGELLDAEQRLLCVTLERPWLANAHEVSCIPPGVYPAHRRLSPKRGYELFELSNVPDRTHIEIHVGNLPKDSEGCILVGSSFGDLEGHRGVLGSKVAFSRFMRRLRDVDDFTLTVTDPLSLTVERSGD